MSKVSNPGILKRASDYLRLVRRLIDTGHDLEALEMAGTILDRSARKFPFDPALDQRGAAICTPEEFLLASDLLKTMEGPYGAALDGGGMESQLAQGGRRFGTVGMPWRRKALKKAAQGVEFIRTWRPLIRSTSQAPGHEWQWRDAGWFHGLPPDDPAMLLFQPVVVLIAPGRGLLERAATVLEQLCPPKPLHVSVARIAEKPLRVPFAAAALIDSAAANPPEIIRLLKAIVQARRACMQIGWHLPAVELVVLGGDPVSACLIEWLRTGGSASAFPAALENAGRGEGALADVYNGATSILAATEIVRELSGGDAAISDFAKLGAGADAPAPVRAMLVREGGLHLLAEHLWRNTDEANIEAHTMDRVRRVDREKLRPHGFDCMDDIAVPAESVVHACSAELPARIFSEEERRAFVAKWAACPEVEDPVVYVFPHIPKTAGSSVHYHLKTKMAYDRAYIHIPMDYTTREELRMGMPFTLRDERDRVQARILFGHGVIRRHAEFVPGKTAREIVTLRDPVERTLSHYNFWMSVLEKRGDRSMSFDEWYADEPRNYHVHWIACNYLELDAELPATELFEAAKGSLENFWMVCTLPTFEQDIERLWSALGLPPMEVRQNVGGVTHVKRFECSDSLRQRLIEENAHDYELYRTWLERNRPRRNAPAAAA